MAAAGRTDEDRAVRAMVAEATGIDPAGVIPANDAAPAPQGLYATVLRVSGDRVGTPSVRRSLSAGKEDVMASTGIRASHLYSVQFYRAGAVEAAQSLQLWIHSPLGRDRQLAQKVFCMEVGDVQDISALVQEAPEERAVLELRIDTARAVMQNLGRVTSIPFSVNRERDHHAP